jgi:hypothetical protein
MTPRSFNEGVVPFSPDYSRLYRLRDPFRGSLFRLSPKGMTQPALNQLDEAWRGDRVPNSPVALRVEMGHRPSDFLWGTYTSIIAISDPLSELMRTHGFTGWLGYPVEIHGKRGLALPGYYGLAITGRAGISDWGRSCLVSKPAWTRGKPRDILVGQYFRNDEWDGSDFSLVGFGGSVIVTQRVVDAFRRASIDNVRFTRLTEVETEVSTLRILGSWPLSASASEKLWS